VAEDYRRGRIYLPREACRRHGYDEQAFAEECFDERFRSLLREEVEFAEDCLRRGQGLVERLPGDLRLDIDLIVRGGLAILRAVRRQDYNVWKRKPRVGKATQVRLLLAAWWHTRAMRPAAV
jgi:phytoene/squalene synthetase